MLYVRVFFHFFVGVNKSFMCNLASSNNSGQIDFESFLFVVALSSFYLFRIFVEQREASTGRNIIDDVFEETQSSLDFLSRPSYS